MSRAVSFAGVILAAGESSRMGTEKALLPWPPVAPGKSAFNDTFLSAAIRSVSLFSDFVLVVVGRNEPVLAPVVYANGASIVVNPSPARGQFSSLQVGLQEVLNRGRDAAVFTLVDRPPAMSETLQILKQAFDAARDNIWAVVPDYAGHHGHPILVGIDLIKAFLRAPATTTAREIEHQYQDRISYVSVNDPLVALNINTPDEYSKLSMVGD